MKLDDQAKAVRREIGMRERVYPSWVSKGRMKPEQAQHELEAMRAVAATLTDYQAMQPKVLALTSVSIALARRLQIPQEEFDKLLVEAEREATENLGRAKLAGAVQGAFEAPA